MVAVYTTVLICLLVYSVHYSTGREFAKCIAFDHTDGCSVPFKGILFPYAKVFEKACDLHDICYDCGSQFEWKRWDCDRKFLLNMQNICKNENEQEECYVKARNYHRAVRWFGFWFYKWISPKWCTIQPCVKSLGSPL